MQKVWCIQEWAPCNKHKCSSWSWLYALWGETAHCCGETRVECWEGQGLWLAAPRYPRTSRTCTSDCTSDFTSEFTSVPVYHFYPGTSRTSRESSTDCSHHQYFHQNLVAPEFSPECDIYFYQHLYEKHRYTTTILAQWKHQKYVYWCIFSETIGCPCLVMVTFAGLVAAVICWQASGQVLWLGVSNRIQRLGPEWARGRTRGGG